MNSTQLLHASIEKLFLSLLSIGSEKWSPEDIGYVKEIVVHGEYEDALQNLIAIAKIKNYKIDDKEIKLINEMAELMGIRNEINLGEIVSS
ncbi:MAG TPA: hypothetical protein PK677_17790 [Acidiphilium sp.]|nr:hypothetical protein [Acidiphilium sp.]